MTVAPLPERIIMNSTQTLFYAFCCSTRRARANIIHSQQEDTFEMLPAPSSVTLTATRGDILNWVQEVFGTSTTISDGAPPFLSLQDVPGKAIAKLLNAIFGSLCPLNHIRFDDDTPTAQLRNRVAVVDLARRAGFDGRLDAVKWSEGNDFANELCFWKWLYAKKAEHNFDAPSSRYDFALHPAAAAKQTAPLVHSAAVPEAGRKRARSSEGTGRPQNPSPATGTLCSNCGDAGRVQLAAAQSSLDELVAIRDAIVTACASRDRDMLVAALARIP